MKTLLPLLITITLTGCLGIFPETQMHAIKEMVRNSGWAAAPQAKTGIDTHWIERFGDHKLKQLVIEAHANNLNLKIAAERIKQAQVRTQAAGAQARPQVSISLGGERNKQNFTNFPTDAIDVISNTSNTFRSGFSAAWELDLWGRFRAQQNAALANQQASKHDYRAARASLTAQIARIWFTIAESNEQITLAQRAIKLRQETVETIQSRFENSLELQGGTSSQLRLAQSDLASARSTLAQWKGQVAQATRQLEVLLGRYPTGQIGHQMKLPRRPKHPPAGLPSQLLLRRPDILAAERRFAAATQSQKEAKLSFFPTLSLTSSLGSQSSALHDLLDSSFGIWSLGAQIARPILTGGQISAEHLRRKSVTREALANLQSTVLTAFGEVERALASEQTLTQQENSIIEALRLARAATQSAKEDYRDGSGDAISLLTTQSREITTASQLASLRRLRLENRINLHLALGGDWKPTNK